MADLIPIDAAVYAAPMQLPVHSRCAACRHNPPLPSKRHHNSKLRAEQD
jgi:hypothetical protein